MSRGGLVLEARKILEAAALDADMSISCAESCTGGSIAFLLTGVEGLSHMFEAGFVVYSDKAKGGVLGIPTQAIEEYGPVSPEIALAMARGVLDRSQSDVAVAVSGYTGDAGPHENGLVHIAVADKTGRSFHKEFHFGEVDRDEGRDLASAAALALLLDTILSAPPPLQTAS